MRIRVNAVGATLDVKSALTIGEPSAEASFVTTTMSKSSTAGVIVPDVFGVLPGSGVVTLWVTVANGDPPVSLPQLDQRPDRS